MERGPDYFNEMSVSVFRALLSNTAPNCTVFCSPLGIATAVAAALATREGVNGAVAEMSQEPMGEGSVNSAAFVQEVQTLLQPLYGAGNMAVGSRLYVDAKCSNLPPDSKTLLEQGLATQLEPANFGRAADVVAQADKWANGFSRGAIQQVLPTWAVEGEQSCLVNVSSFSGDWDDAFVYNRAVQLPFYNEPGRSVFVPTMTQTLDADFVRSDAYQVLRLPYQDPVGCQLIVFLPTLQDGLNEVLLLLSTWQDMKAAMSGMVWTSDVTVMLPRMCFVSDTYDLSTALKGHTMGSALESCCREQDTSDIQLRRVMHKASLDMYEDGYRCPPTVSTMLSLCTNIPPNDPVHFTVDRPFLFLVIRAQVIYMMGAIRRLPAK